MGEGSCWRRVGIAPPLPYAANTHTHTHACTSQPQLQRNASRVSLSVFCVALGYTRVQFQPVSGSASPSHREKAGPRFLFSVGPTSDWAGAGEPHSFLKRAALAGSRRRCLPVLGPTFARSPPPRRKPGTGLNPGSLVYMTYCPSQPTHNSRVFPSGNRSDAGEAAQVRRGGRARCPRWPQPRAPLGPSSEVVSVHSASAQPSPLPSPARPPSTPHTGTLGTAAGLGAATLKRPLDWLPSALGHGVTCLGPGSSWGAVMRSPPSCSS